MEDDDQASRSTNMSDKCYSQLQKAVEGTEGFPGGIQCIGTEVCKCTGSELGTKRRGASILLGLGIREMETERLALTSLTLRGSVV